MTSRTAAPFTMIGDGVNIKLFLQQMPVDDAELTSKIRAEKDVLTFHTLPRKDGH